jgi:hypothetical protein
MVSFENVLIVLRSILAHRMLHISSHLAGLQLFNESGYAMVHGRDAFAEIRRYWPREKKKRGINVLS